MGGNLANFGQVGAANKPSPSIWKDCSKQQLDALGDGIYREHNFLNNPIVTSTITSALLGRLNTDGFNLDGDDDTVLKQHTTNTNGVLHVETDGDDNDAIALFAAPFGKITRNSGQKLWFEAYVALGSAAADSGVFFGLAELAAMSRDLVADNAAAGAVIGESLVGFLVDNGDLDAVDFVYKKDAGTIVIVKSDITNAAAITSAGGTTASIVANVFVKLGLRFDGRTKLQAFVNGYLVATQDIDTTFDQAKQLGAILTVKTGTAAAVDVKVDWVRYAFQASQ